MADNRIVCILKGLLYAQAELPLDSWQWVFGGLGFYMAVFQYNVVIKNIW